ncbi:SusC/RagA family TonB-linked outer membrane protein [Tenacibaculum haliotis]|uniref:SusC/RagA family TonB-linked outer membrane protein n=1 Tax=Tenacibaculum haliotis TaxID=1888914 RepID=UPI0021AF3460|nr:SusC/RagA family TonB-linked outer membrane protein [Tenacibaculum haliotis]MCT4697866.1 SusC/RagA family TonB-linked outer membrane protein [Tenacibaculum haliotis]
MKTKFNGILTLLLALVVQISFAQDKTISGTVSDESGPLPGVTVMKKGTTQGGETNFDGKYTIKAKIGDVLVFSFVGMKMSEKTVGTSNMINVIMATDNQLEEIIVLGYTSKSKNELTGNAVTIKADQIENVPVLSIDQALQGKVAGLQISSTSGTPGAVQDIRIRGAGSLSASNSPLYVIDGVPMISGDFSGSTSNSSLSALVSVNSKDVASMTVLKDASATAAYGARGSNGVILITTKKGKTGKAKFSFTSSFGYQNEAKNDRRALTGAEREELLVESIYRTYATVVGLADIDDARAFTYANNVAGVADWDKKEYNWGGLVENKDAMIKNYNLSVSGGSENTNYYVSLGYNQTEMIVIGDPFKRITGSLNLNTKLRDNLKLSQSINVSNSKQRPISEGGSTFSNPYLTRYYMNPFFSPYNADGTYNLDIPLHNTLYGNSVDDVSTKLTRFGSNTKIDYEFIENLTFSTTIGLDFVLSEFKDYKNRYNGDGRDVNGYSQSSDTKNFNYVVQNSLNYKFNVNDHNFDVTALFEYQKNQSNYLYAYGENFPTDGLTNIASAGANYEASSSFTDWINVSYLGMLNYNYDQKYILDATFRREGSSRFGSGNRFGNFGSVGVAWNIHKEDFLSDTQFNSLRLRGSWGITGNSGIATNSYQALLSFDADYAGNGASYASQLGNPLLAWEKGTTYDVGLDFGLYNNRLRGNVSYYNRKTYDLLQSVPLSATTAFSGQTANIGEALNTGIEAEISYDIINNDNLLWSVSANYGTVKNEVTKLAKNSIGEDINPLEGSTYKATIVGQPISGWNMRTWAGVDPATGSPTWYVDGVSGAVTSDYNSAARVYQGASALPTYNGGVSTHLKYKSFFLDASLYFTGGHKVYEQYAQHYFRTNSFTLASYNGTSELLDRWQKPGDITNVPKLAYGGSDNFHSTSSRHLYDGDYLRLRDVTIGFEFPESVLKNTPIESVTLTAKATNLYTWVKDSGLKLDPEVQASGYSSLVTPPVKSVVFGININF